MSAASTTPASKHIPAPEPALLFPQMLARAESMRLAIRQRQQQCEDLGRTPPQTHQDFLQAGFYRVAQQPRFGGYGFGPLEFTRLIIEISRACIDTGWVLSILASAPSAYLASFPESTLFEAYGPNGDCRAVCVLKPGGAAIPSDGAFMVKGSWDYCSGCDIATHVAATLLIRDSAAAPPKGVAIALLRRDEFEIVDNWSMIGMQGTGSRRVTVSEQMIPANRVAPFSFDPQSQPPPSLDADPSLGGLAPAAVAVGAARGALDLYEEILRSKKFVVPPFPFLYEMPEMQQNFGNVQAMIDLAEAGLLSLASQCSERLRLARLEGVPFQPADLRRILRAANHATELAWNAVETMFRTAGSSCATKAAPLGRYFRGLATLRTHIGLQANHSSINVARLHFGLPPLSPI